MSKHNNDSLQYIHEEYIKQVSESGVSLYELQQQYLYELYCGYTEGKVGNVYNLLWKDEYGQIHEQVCSGFNIYEAMAFIETQAYEFGHKACTFVKVEVADFDKSSSPGKASWDDLPF